MGAVSRRITRRSRTVVAVAAVYNSRARVTMDVMATAHRPSATAAAAR